MEKRGNTGKITYDRVIENALQCLVESNGVLYPTTPREFRSWNGKRVIVVRIEGIRTQVEYTGPLYYWNTNTICKEPTDNGTQYISDRPIILRPGERRLLEDIDF